MDRTREDISEDSHLAHLAKRVDELELLVKRLQEIRQDHSSQLIELALLHPLHVLVPIVQDVLHFVDWMRREWPQGRS